MKSFLKLVVTKILALRARQLLRRHRTQVIAVTGSIGKTSTKEAIYTILRDHFKTYRSAKGFNTDLGVSLAVLQEEESRFSSVFGWLKILYRAFFTKKEAYQKIVLEFGANRPGDIRRLIKTAKPKISVITNVSPSHLAEGQFPDIAAIAKEKSALIRHMAPGDVAVLNGDDPLVRAMETQAQKIFYGIDSPAPSSATHLKATEVEIGIKGIRFLAHYKTEKVSFSVPVVGAFQVAVLLPAIAVALQLGLSLQDCAKSLKQFRLPPGRMSVLPGINKSTLLDASYNASPATMKSALELLGALPAKRKIAALGTMNELGSLHEEAHRDAGALAAKYADFLIAVGASANLYKRGAVAAGMKEEAIYTFLDSEEAAYFSKTLVEPRDLILIKGSQDRVRMEKFVKLVLAHPETAGQLLCRQGEAWNKIY
ncbi:UDP-N-acetylmuramoyl-tripeptide--D-alanyl-D-alanine ligase [Candidatus Peregrinibacteria bacterium]|nr:UDP-N-acetylmuramoyl-tripeptide--D-alanyl-D-alanine ligase [Candidatus Peregrinibacteria bacterium]